MYHSILIGRKSNGNWDRDTTSRYRLRNTWADYHLIPSTRPSVNPPEIRTNYVDVPGVDGVLDLTESLTGAPLYKNREGSWDFIVDNDHEDWSVIFHKLQNDLHGVRWDVSLEDDPFYYYKGRISVDEWKSNRDWSKITLNYYFEPYKYEFNSANEPWLWDPFSFETGYIRKYGSSNTYTDSSGQIVSSPLIVNGNNSLTLEISPSKRWCPIIINVITVTSTITVSIGGGSPRTLNAGRNDLTSWIITHQNEDADPSQAFFTDKKTVLKFSGVGTIWVEFQGGWL